VPSQGQQVACYELKNFWLDCLCGVGGLSGLMGMQKMALARLLSNQGTRLVMSDGFSPRRESTAALCLMSCVVARPRALLSWPVAGEKSSAAPPARAVRPIARLNWLHLTHG